MARTKTNIQNSTKTHRHQNATIIQDKVCVSEFSFTYKNRVLFMWWVRQWFGIIQYYWWTTSVKPRLLFLHASYASLGHSLFTHISIADMFNNMSTKCQTQIVLVVWIMNADWYSWIHKHTHEISKCTCLDVFWTSETNDNLMNA